MRFVAVISQGFRTCLKPNAILLRQKLHRVAATKIACVNGPSGKFNEGRTGGSLAWFTNLKNRGSRFTDIKNLFPQITKIRK